MDSINLTKKDDLVTLRKLDGLTSVHCYGYGINYSSQLKYLIFNACIYNLLASGGPSDKMACLEHREAN